MLESELKQENEMKNEWLYHFAFFAVPNVNSVQKDKEFSRASEHSNHDIGVCATDKLCLVLLMKETDMIPKAPRLRRSDRRATPPDSNIYTGEGGASRVAAISCFSPSEGG